MIKYDFLEIIQQLELTQSWLDWLCGRSCRYLGPCAIPGSAQLQLSSTLALSWLQARASATLSRPDSCRVVHPFFGCP